MCCLWSIHLQAAPVEREIDIFKRFSILESPGKLLRTTHFVKGDQGWNHFFDPATQTILLSVQCKDGDLPKNIEVSSGLLNDYGKEAFDYSNSPMADKAAFFAMNRYWRIKGPNNSSGSYKVRFYFSSQDIDDLKTSFQKYNYNTPQVGKLNFYSLDGTNKHPFSEGSEQFTTYVNDKERALVMSQQFHYTEFEINSLNCAGSGGFKQNLADRNFWIKGKINAYFQDQLPNIFIIPSTNELNSIRLNHFGKFSIPVAGGAKNIQLSLGLETEDLSYINIADLIRLREHLDGDRPITEEELLLAADMDNNGEIDEYDFDFLHNLVKGKKQGFSAAHSFIFYTQEDWDKYLLEKNHFTRNNTWQIKQLKQDVEQNFVLIVKGNLSQEKHSLQPSVANKVWVEKVKSCGYGEEKTVSIYAKMEKGTKGLQFSLDWNTAQLEFLGINNGLSKSKKGDYFNLMMADEGMIAFACTDTQSLQSRNGRILIGELNFKVIGNNPNAGIQFTDFPSGINAMNKDTENISIQVEDGLISKDEERSIQAVELDIKQPSCQNPKSGQISIKTDEGILSDMITWSDQKQGFNRKGLSEGIYSFTIQKKGKCLFKSEEIEFEVPEKPEVVSVDQTSLQCIGGSDASIELNVQGGKAPYYFYWNNDQRTAKASNLSSGNYQVEITDSNNCTIFEEFEVESNGNLGLEYYIKNPSGKQQEDGIIEVLNIQGLENDKINFEWGSGKKGNKVENLRPGRYQLYFSTEDGCKYQKNFVLQPSRDSFQASAFLYEQDIDNGFDKARIRINSPFTKKMTINLYDQFSNVVWSNTVLVQTGVTTLYLPIPEKKAKYLLQIPDLLTHRFSVE